MGNEQDKDVKVNEDDGRQKYLQIVSKKLVYLTFSCLSIVVILYYVIPIIFKSSHTYLSIYVFIAGLIGGFMSIQQRLPKIGINELRELSNSWISILLIPVNGGVFAIVLMVMIISGILQGAMFPKFNFPENLTGFQALMKAFPENGAELAKLLFWSFVAGFSERFVPQIVRKTAQSEENK
jgi:hypothetical protein